MSRIRAWINAHPITVFYGSTVALYLATILGPEIHPAYYVTGIATLIVAPLVRTLISRRFEAERLHLRIQQLTEERDTYKGGVEEVTENLRQACERTAATAA